MHPVIRQEHSSVQVIQKGNRGVCAGDAEEEGDSNNPTHRAQRRQHHALYLVDSLTMKNLDMYLSSTIGHEVHKFHLHILGPFAWLFALCISMFVISSRL